MARVKNKIRAMIKLLIRIIEQSLKIRRIKLLIQRKGLEKRKMNKILIRKMMKILISKNRILHG